jgi:putative oxidoreductase
MKFNIFSTPKHSKQTDIMLLIVRVVTGIAFIIHGSGKIQNPTQWMGNDALFPPFFQGLAAVAEFGGGIALTLGVITRLGAFGIACTMLFALYMHLFLVGDPFINQSGGGSYELALVFFAIALMLLVNGPGKYSLDRMIFGVKSSE